MLKDLEISCVVVKVLRRSRQGWGVESGVLLCVAVAGRNDKKNKNKKSTHKKTPLSLIKKDQSLPLNCSRSSLQLKARWEDEMGDESSLASGIAP